MPEVLVLQHVDCEPLGTIEDALSATSLKHRYIQAYQGQPVPLETGDAPGLIVMGGPMGVSQENEYPFLSGEMRLIEQALARGLPVLGVCLGSQLLATVLGAAVRRGRQQEIGWHPVTLAASAAQDALFHTVPSPVMGFHWHGDQFDVPPGAVSLGFTELTPCQIFRYGDLAYGLQFHMEVTERIIRSWAAAFSGELADAGMEATPLLEGISSFLTPWQQAGQTVFGQWAKLAADRA